MEKLFLVCTGPRCNAETRGDECGLNIRDLLKDTNKKMGRKPTVRVISVSCLDLCDHGPNMVVHPDSAVAAYHGVMGDGPRRDDLELSEEEFREGSHSKSVST